jgi:HK97 family phage major capsid protein
MFDTESDAIEYARQTAFTNTAAAVAEATSTTTGTKPEATLAFEKVTAPVATYATWAPVTRRGLSGVGELRDVVDGQLTYGARRALEEAVVAAMVAGAGSTQAKGADTSLVDAPTLRRTGSGTTTERCSPGWASSHTRSRR